ncbi:MAG: 4-alpha-glucanotransferase [Tannerella sp.]|jgi:4-alpha-glucanotransferase|nr:4-alpha-glucanotransferase [Tannerella sp.]
MKVTFHIDYRAGEGEKLCIIGSVVELGIWQSAEAKEMCRMEGGRWMFRIAIPPSVKEIDYRYILIKANGDVVSESWERIHHAVFDSSRPVYHLYDYWRNIPPDIALYTSAFTKVLFAHKTSGRPTEGEDSDRTWVIRVLNPRVEKHQHVAIAGNQACLGFWRPEQAKAMDSKDFPEWEIRLNADEITLPLEYKFLVRDETMQVCHWETGDNRILTHLPSEKGETVVVSGYPYRTGLPLWKGAGTVIPVFSLRSEQSFGTGDMHDLKLLIDWAEQTGQCLIQVLPMNDTTRTHTWTDSYPYSAISIYALHPVYISLADMGTLKDVGKASFFRRMQKTLNVKGEVDYESVEKNKLQYCRDFFEQEGAAVLKSDTFKSFLKTARTWLIPYASFCYYRDKYQTPDFSRWGAHATYEALREQQLCEENSDAYPEIAFTCFLQFVLHTQFKAVSDYARQKGIILKGDLPIGIHRTSVEAWTETSYFNMDGQAGAPPDVFSDKGQNWSFPTYNWDAIEKDDFAWWKKRFHKLEDYYTGFRIDHILGFFRIWEIPVDFVQGLCGHFRPALPFSVEEIEAYGLTFKETFTKPRIHCRHLAGLFGGQTDDVVETCLSPADAAWMILKPFCDTQRKIEDLFRNRTDEVSMKIKEGLFAIANEVLFLEDPYEKSKFHPRISASGSFAYKELTDEERHAFDRLSLHFFYERHNEFWKKEALKRLTPLIACTDMLICGEDLGMIPDSVHEVMNRLHILSLELERAPKTSDREFADLHHLPYESVCTTSTHDMNPLRSWWKEDRERTQRYYQFVLHKEGAAPEECSPELAAQILSRHLDASSMLTIIPLQDWLAMSDTLKSPHTTCERINIPADPHHYWRYRIHIPLEKLLIAREFNRKIRTMLSDSGR